jgi:hypothetical protein
MEKLVSLVTKVPRGRRRTDDDFTDRVSHRITVIILVVFAVIATGRLYIGKPITCWVPKHFTGSHTKFTNSYCWVRSTYYLPFEDYIPKKDVREDEIDKRELLYYQWLPFILLTQAFFFYVPCLVWRAFNSRAGVDADNILEAADKLQNAKDQSSRDKTLRLMVRQLDRCLNRRRHQGGVLGRVKAAIDKVCCMMCSKGQAQNNYLVTLYLIVKVLYLANALTQLYILNAVLRTDYSVYGIEALKNLINDQYLMSTPVFPRVTMCDFLIRVLGNVQRYTVQCVLPINLYAEKMYAFFWFWLVMVAVLSAFSLFTWAVRCIITQDRIRYIKGHLKGMDRVHKDSEKDSYLVGEFVDDFLGQDGVLLLRFIGHNTNHLTSTSVTAALFDHWLETIHKKTDGLPLNDSKVV